MGKVPEANFNPCWFDANTTYFWRIDEIGPQCTTKGNVWSFETIGPEIGLSATQFEFTALEGGANPADQILGIFNSGAGTINWQINEDCGWLTALPASGSSTEETDEVTLSADISGLAGGIYTCDITISDGNASNSPQTVGVSLIVTGPEIGLSATQFQFTAIEGGANPAEQILGIFNSGGGIINWQIIEGCDWLSAEPSSGSSTGEIDSVTLSVDISGLAAGLVGWWKFDETSGTIAYDSADSHNGTLVNGPVWTTGKIAGGLSFDGSDDYVDCGSDPSLDVTELTWSLWIKRAETTYNDERALISNEGGGNNTSGTYALQIDTNGSNQDKIQFVKHGDASYALSNTAIQDVNWHHIAVTRQSDNTVVIYIDGAPNGGGTVTARTAFIKTVIGAGNTAYSRFKGTIDDVRIYNSALSAEEIEQIYLEGL
jgi:hypothetical protein